jgi:hypothetical protein
MLDIVKWCQSLKTKASTLQLSLCASPSFNRSNRTAAYAAFESGERLPPSLAAKTADAVLRHTNISATGGIAVMEPNLD